MEGNRKVLIAEDEATQRRLLSVKLKKQGYEVVEAVNGADGLQHCLEDPGIRLVITDLMMPTMDGFDLIKKLRKKETRYTYVIVLTALEDKKSIIKALSLGADDFLTKPVFQDELNLRLSSALRLLKLESQDELIMTMVKLAGSRSGETGGHLERVLAYCRILALDIAAVSPSLVAGKNIAEEISQVSPLHDIGKVGIPDSILHKPGRLTSDEFEKMKTHAKVGGDILKEVYEKTGASYLKIAFEIAMYHHERWDGGGYPEGLKGEEIPVSARIMALADVFDALTSKRCYKDAFSYDRAKSIIVEERGAHFDPVVVDAYLRKEKECINVLERLDS